MNVGDFFSPGNLKASDLRGRRAKVIITNVRIEKFPDGNKPVLHFKDKVKGLVLNMTNARTISNVYGPEMDTWPGKSIILYTTMVEYQGQQTEGIRIEIPHDLSPAVASSGLGDDVR
jgi:hypothetical protein